MKKLNFQKDILPHLIAIAIFLILTIIFFKPSIFDGKVLVQGDIQQWEASATELIDYREQTGEEGLWTNSIFGGMPAYLISVEWRSPLIKLSHAIFTLGLPHPARLLFGSMLSFYIMLLCFKVRPYLAIIGAIAFGCSSYNLVAFVAGHNARVSALSFTPLIMGAMHLCLTRNKWLGASLLALGMAMQLRADHIQMTYYTGFIIAIYAILQLFYAYKDGKMMRYIQRLGILIAAVVLAIGTYFGDFYGTYEMGKYSNRGQSELTQQADEEKNKDGLSKLYAFQYSNGTWDPMTLFIPGVLGGNASLSMDSNIAQEYMRQGGANRVQAQQQLPVLSSFLYWGSETPTTYYAGAIMVFLFVIGILFVERKYTIWLVAVAVLGILLSYGRNFSGLNYFLFDYFPGYNKFRSVTFLMVLPIFAIGLLGMLGLEKVMHIKWDKATQKKFLIALASTAGLALLLAVFAGAFGYRSAGDNPQWPDWLKEALSDDRKTFLRADSFRSFIFIALFAGVFYLHSIQKLSKSITYALFILLIGIDIVSLGKRFMTENRFQNAIAAEPIALAGDQFISQNKALGDRVIDLTPGIFYDGRASRFNHSINGYNGARLRRFQDLLDARIQGERDLLRQMVQNQNLDLSSAEMINMLNGRFVIANPNDAQGIIVNNNANGAAWFVGRVESVNSPDEELARTQEINTKTTAVIDVSKYSIASSAPSVAGTINLVDYHPGYWKYESNNAGEGLAVFSEIHYPKDFVVTIDGEPVEMLRVNYILRALEIPAGQHTIDFKFAPKIYGISSLIMQISSVLTLLLFAGSVYLSFKEQ